MSSWWKIISLVSAVPKKTSERQDDDIADRMSNRYSVLLLVVFTIVLSMHQYMGKPITCWAPKHITRGQTKYVNNYCWVRNTYRLPFEDNIPRPDDRDGHLIYYQWIPFILLAQALLFYLPAVVWHALNEKAGVDADNILATAGTFQQQKGSEVKEKHLLFITRQFDRFLTSRPKPEHHTGCSLDVKQFFLNVIVRLCGGQGNSYLTVLYLFVKILYLSNVIGQLFLLSTIMGFPFTQYGVDMTRMLIDDAMPENPLYFPRVTMCDFSVRRLGNVHPYTVQCVLPINLYNEKVFFFMWYWMLLVAGITGVSFLKWFWRALMATDRYRYIDRHLSMAGRLSSQKSHRLVHKFVDDYLGRDGVFLLRLIGHNTNRITATEVTCSLWERWARDLGNMAESEDEDEKRPKRLSEMFRMSSMGESV